MTKKYDNKLLKAVTNLGEPKILLIGDFMLDSYVYGDALRISPEAPVPVLKTLRREYNCGGAASVAADIVAFGGTVVCIGTIGDDANGKMLAEKLTEIGADISSLLITAGRPTTSKQRLIGLAQHRHRQQLMRIDEECTDELSTEQQQVILQSFKEKLSKADIVCLQDHNKGLLTRELCGEIIRMANNASVKVLVDPAAASDYSKYKGAAIITPNRNEAAAVTGVDIQTDEDAAKAAEKLLAQSNSDAVIITLDKEGAYLKTKDIDEIVPTVARKVYDVTGAGDTVLATLAVTLAGGCDYRTAVELANVAGGIEVEKFGVATVTVDEIVNEIIARQRGKSGKIFSAESLEHELQWYRRQKQTIVFTNGCFDVLHRGHVEYLEFCRKQGDVVVLGLNSDSSVKALKGPERPINNQHDRAAVLASLESVDYIVIFEETGPLNIIKKVKPDILIKGEDWADKEIIGKEFVEARGGKLVLAPLVKDKSSTSTIEKIKTWAAKSFKTGDKS